MNLVVPNPVNLVILKKYGDSSDFCDSGDSGDFCDSGESDDSVESL